MKAAIIVKPKEPLQVQDFETADLDGSRVFVKVVASCLCHSDIHL